MGGPSVTQDQKDGSHGQDGEQPGVSLEAPSRSPFAVATPARLTTIMSQTVGGDDDGDVVPYRALVLESPLARRQAPVQGYPSQCVGFRTSFVERQHATARGQDARRSRRTYRFSKDWRVHESMTYFTLYRYKFSLPVRALRVRDEDGPWQQRTPAMAAGLADHVWSLKEWLRGCESNQRFTP